MCWITLSKSKWQWVVKKANKKKRKAADTTSKKCALLLTKSFVKQKDVGIQLSLLQ